MNLSFATLLLLFAFLALCGVGNAATPRPTSSPSGQPTHQPTSSPSSQPTRQPTSRPTRQPTGQPSRQPSRQPTTQPSSAPTRLAKKRIYRIRKSTDTSEVAP
ncbi:hypothetical protein EON63_06470 [archaeon]|nr:MAG: hypothetical protein EON63_06470 [archaeon]